MERLSVDELRETLAREIASLPEALRSCTGEALANQLAPIFSDEDHERCAPRPPSAPRPSPPFPRVFHHYKISRAPLLDSSRLLPASRRPAPTPGPPRSPTNTSTRTPRRGPVW